MFWRCSRNILFGLFWLSADAFAQHLCAQVSDYTNIRFRQYTVLQGLPSDACTKIYKDSYGFLWVSTYYGVSIFNGNRFINLPVNSSKNDYYLGDCPYTFLQLNKDSMLISCSDGLYIFGYASKTASKLPDQPPVPARARISLLGFDRSGAKILVKTGASIYFLNKRLKQYDSVVCADENLELSSGAGFYAPYYFYYSNSGYLISLNTESGKTDSLLYRPGERAGMLVSNQFPGGYLVATSTSVLLIEAKTNTLIRTIPIPAARHGAPFIPFCIRKDASGNFWIGGRANLFIYFPATNRIIVAGTSFTDSVSNKAINVNDIINDTDGLFVATIDNGLLKYDNRYTIFEDHSLPAAMNSSVYSSIVEGNQLLAAPITGGIIRFAPEETGNNHKLYPFPREYGDVLQIEKLDNRRIWLIFRRNFKLAIAGLSDFKPLVSDFPVDSIAAAYFRKVNSKFPRVDLQPIMKKLADGLFYYTIGNYLYRVTGSAGKGFTFSLADSISPPAYISAIGISPAKTILIGTDDLQLFELRGARLVKRYSPGYHARLAAKAICIDDAGTIYLLTVDGLYILDKDYRLRRHLTTPDTKLLNNILYAGAIDKKGLLWMTANGGLTAYDTKSARITNFSSAGLLHGREFNSRSVCVDSLGGVYFGGTNGITEVHTNLISTNGGANTLYLEKIKVFDSVVHDGIIPGALGSGAAFRYNKNTFSFSIGWLSYRQLEDINYRYMLEGFDTAWNSPTDNHTLTYINLPPGKYRFRVDQAPPDTAAGREISYSFQIDKPYWQTAWFVLLIALSAIGLLGFIIRYFVDKRFEKQRIEGSKEMALKTERERISQELHDDLGSGLTSIRLLAKGVIAKQHSDGKTAAMLQNIAKISGELIDQMSEIVWLMNHMHDTMNGLLAHLRVYMADYLQRTGIALGLHFQNAIQADNHITGQQRRSILLVVKEAFHNVVKHSGATDFSITCSADKDAVKVVISDNGIGLPEHISLTGNGLNNIKKRIASINGTVQFETDSGTRITIIIPIHQK
jgi:signal transduction histidine kinase/ligand-binding sensor domain-containing protein